MYLTIHKSKVKFHFKKVVFDKKKVKRLVFGHNKLNNEILSKLQYFREFNNLDFEIVEENKKGVIKF